MYQNKNVYRIQRRYVTDVGKSKRNIDFDTNRGYVTNFISVVFISVCWQTVYENFSKKHLHVCPFYKCIQSILVNIYPFSLSSHVSNTSELKSTVKAKNQWPPHKSMNGF